MISHRLKPLAFVSLFVGIQACGNAFEFRSFGNGPPIINNDAGLDGGTIQPIENLLPDALLGDASRGDGGTEPDAVVNCAPAMNRSIANICVRVQKDPDAPAINADTAKELQIDGLGALTIGLTRELPEKISPSPSWVSVINFPSPGGSSKYFDIKELPKQTDFPVDPGTYYAFAVFRDRSPFQQAKFDVGDSIGWGPLTNAAPQPIKVIAGQALSLTIVLQSVRQVNVEVKQGSVRPLGNGTGDVYTAITSQSSSKPLADEWSSTCVDILKAGSYPMRLFTYGKGSLFLHTRLYDFDLAKSFEDPIPSGTLMNAVEGLPFAIPQESWVAPKQVIELDRVAPFSTGSIPPDPSPYCPVVIP